MNMTKKLLGLVVGGLSSIAVMGAHAAELDSTDLAKGVTEIVEVKAVKPDYPADALYRKREGSIVFKFNIDTAGNPHGVELVSVEGSKVFLPVSRRAMDATRFEPVIVNGERVNVTGVLRKFTYKLVDDNGQPITNKSDLVAVL